MNHQWGAKHDVDIGTFPDIGRHVVRALGDWHILEPVKSDRFVDGL